MLKEEEEEEKRGGRGGRFRWKVVMGCGAEIIKASFPIINEHCYPV